MSSLVEVLHVIDTYRIGGPGKTVINSAKYIDRRRYRVHVASFTSLDDSRNEFATAVRAADIPYLALPETRRVNLSHLWSIREYVRRERVSILHLHGYRYGRARFHCDTRAARGVGDDTPRLDSKQSPSARADPARLASLPALPWR